MEEIYILLQSILVRLIILKENVTIFYILNIESEVSFFFFRNGFLVYFIL